MIACLGIPVAQAAALPTVTINDVTLAEGNSGSTSFTFTVNSSGDPAAGEQVNWTVNDIDTEATDFTGPTSGSIILADGDQPITVTVTGDTVYELQESFTVDLSAPNADVTFADSSGLGQINNDDTAPTLSISSPSADEEDGTITFVVTRTGLTEEPASATYATSDGTAAATADFLAASGTTPAIAAGGASGTANVTITLVDNNTYEGTQQFSVALTVPINATIPGSGIGTGTITDETDAPTLTIGNVSVDESVGIATFIVTRTGATELAASATFTTANGTATAGADFVAASASTGPIPAGSANDTTSVSVTLLPDNTFEGNETFTVTLSTPINAVLGAPATGTGTITDATDTPTLAIDDVSVSEGAGTATFTVTLTGASNLTASVPFSATNGTAGAGDYSVTPGTLNFAAGVAPRQQTITANITNDGLNEPTENYTVNLGSPTGATVADGSGLGTIVDNDDATLSVGNVTQNEGNAGTTTFSFDVALSAPSAGTVNFTWSTSAGTTNPATAGTDYVAVAAAPLSFTPGSQLVTASVTVNGDPTHELDETFLVSATLGTTPGAGAVTVAPTPGTGTITNDDAAPTISIGNLTLLEGTGGATTAQVPVTLSAASGLPTPITFTASTADVTAIAGSDFTGLAAAAFQITPGQTSVNVPVSINPDDLFENVASEAFTVSIANVVNANPVPGPTTATVTITEDDVQPTVTIADASVLEGDVGTAPVAFAVTLDHPSVLPISLRADTAGAAAPTATPNLDYGQVVNGLVSIPALATGATFTVNAVADLLDEDDERFTVNLTNPVNVTPGATMSAIGTITDNDPLPALSISDVNQPEGNSGTSPAALTVTLSPVSGRQVSVNYATGLSGAGSDATAGVDYVATLGPLTFAPGETTKPVSVSIIGDVAIEGSETVGVILSSPVNATLPARPGLIVIADDDQIPIAPFPTPDAIVTPRDTAGAVQVLANDTDANGDFLRVTDNTSGAHGSAICTFNGTCTYTPAPGYLGPDTFTYTVFDGTLASIGTVNVTVFRPNNAPVARTDRLRTVQNYPFRVRVITNDTDAQGDPLRVIRFSNGKRGRVTCTSAVCTYRPARGFIGNDRFTYTVSDGSLVATGTVLVNVRRKLALQARAVAGPRRVRRGGAVTYTSIITNPNPVPVIVRNVSACLPPGFTYIPGSTRGSIRRAPSTGACSNDRVRLTWTRTVAIRPGSRIVVRFRARAGAIGLARFAVTARAASPFTTRPSGATAAVNVTRR